MKIEIPTRHLLAANVFVDKDHIRPYMTGVLIEVTDDAIYCIGTNGHALGATRHSHRGSYAGQYIIPSDAIKALKKPKAADEMTPINFLPGGAFRFLHQGTWQFIDANYLDWRRLIPKEPPSGESAQFDIHLLHKYVEAAQILVMRKSRLPLIGVGYNGKRETQVVIDGLGAEFLGVAMPLRCEFPFSEYFTSGFTL